MRTHGPRPRQLPHLAVAVARRYWSGNGPNWAAAVGLRLLLALLPIAVLAGLAIRAVLHTPPATSTAGRLGLRATARIAQSEQSLTSLLSSLIGDLNHSGHTLGILSVIGLLWIGSGLFACLESCTAALYGTRGRPYLHQRALGIGLVVAFAALVVAGILLSVLLFPLGSAVQRTGTLGQSAVHNRLTLQPAAGIVIGVALFALVFRVLPTCRQRWVDILPGVVTAAAANALLNLIWPLYLRYATSTLTVSYVVFGFVVAIATYVSVLSQLVVLSISLNATLRARRIERLEAALEGTPVEPAMAGIG